MIADARSRVAAFVNGRRPEEIGFGMNATSFIRTVSLAVGQIQMRERVPTFCFTLPGIAPAAVTQAAVGIGIRDGHMYSPRLMARLGLTAASGAVRMSLAHYNTAEEVRQLGGVLMRLRRPAASVSTR